MDNEPIRMGDNVLYTADVLLKEVREKIIGAALERGLLYGLLIQLIGNDEFEIEINLSDPGGMLILEPLSIDKEGNRKYKITVEPLPEEYEE